MKRKKVIAIATAVIIVIAYVAISGRNGVNGDSITVARGDISREIFEAGTVKKGEEIMLSFGIPGTVQTIDVTEGESLRAGQRIATLERGSIEAESDRARAALRAAEIELRKLVAGGSDMDVRIARTVTDNAVTALASANRNLEKAEETAEERMKNAYDGAIPSLSDAILAANSAHDAAKEVSKTHFSGFYSADVRSALAARDRIERALEEMVRGRDNIKGGDDRDGIDFALSIADSKLKDIIGDLDLIRKILENEPYREISQTETALLMSEMASVNRSSSAIVSLIGSVSTARLIGETEILAAESARESAEGALAQAEDRLSMTISPTRSEDIELAEIRVAQARSDLRIIQKRLEDAEITAPFDGRVLKTDIRTGEFVQAGMPVVLIVPDAPYQAEVHIYEGEIAGIRVGDPVEIEIVAFPNRIIEGKVIFIEQASKIVDGVVNYRVLTSMDDHPEGIMFGMTADVTIVPEKRENVLYLPDSAIMNGTVLLIDNGRISEVEVETGLRGFDRNVEIISGLNEGDRVVASR